MDLIKDKEKVIDLTNKLINNYGNPKDLAKSLDDLFFDWLIYFGNNGECNGTWLVDRISTVKGVRDFLSEIETNL
jgi:hypothetical protein